ncbi:nucleotidyl transferase AbiEii/AbiGii toxin family protein [Candidatus Gottesmanbacteria bacterium]|nr:nucleotidyl transferase AbiEii/AbiGii toxin family protein [Candidatus Gottesmanbacteria bacterium]
MIAEDLQKKLAQKYQTTELNIRREYLQQLFLRYFYLKSTTDNVFFKGGTALKIIYGSPRFSEDLDFSSTQKEIKFMEAAILETLEDIEKEGINLDLKEAKTTSGGYLSRISFKFYKDSKDSIDVLLNISIRMRRVKGEVVTIVSDFMPAYTVMALDRDQLVGEKIRALLSRRKARDFYDLYFILRANLLPPKEKAVLSRVLEILKRADLNFEKELKQFLPKSHWPVIKNFKQALSREIERVI